MEAPAKDSRTMPPFNTDNMHKCEDLEEISWAHGYDVACSESCCEWRST